MSTKHDRTALIALVAGGIALLLGLCLGALAGSVTGYVIGRQVEKSIQRDTLPRQLPEMPAMPEMPLQPELPNLPAPPGRLMGASGALIQEVLPGSPAQRAGLQVGDLITAVNGIPVDANHPLVEVLALLKPGDRASLQIWRDGRTITVDVMLGTHPEDRSRPYIGIYYTEWGRLQRQEP